ncbi:YafY family protein [uncultured Ruegeria sp.]|uniref:helix-turn-helix transcriptional regulator n=1 Tax=uncultured Ruegeria sp. TaxID=259304 RepID=UPI0026190DBF|nr:YafY family protein [uncultured Ruegeria sp.]
MSRSARLFEIIQLLRNAKGPILAREIAVALEISIRTVYRDIASLQAMQTPILGEPGVGYVMRKGYDLPPINFDVEEAEAISVGLSLIARTGDPGLWRSAGRASRKLHEAAPSTRRLLTSAWGIESGATVNLSEVRLAIRNENKILIDYCDVEGRETKRTIWPLVLIYYVDAGLIVAWCELREAVRHFRLDRIIRSNLQSDDFAGLGEPLIEEWEATQMAGVLPTRNL